MMSLIFALISSLTMLQCHNTKVNQNDMLSTEVSVNQTVESVEVMQETPNLIENKLDIVKQSEDMKELNVMEEESIQTEIVSAKTVTPSDEIAQNKVVTDKNELEKTQPKKDNKTAETNKNAVEQVELASKEVVKIVKPAEPLDEGIEKADARQKEMENEAVLASPKAEQKSEMIPFSHDKWNKILQANVSEDGKVNYAGIKSSVKELDAYLEFLSSNTPQSNWSANKTKAYWINVYNAFTIKLIVDNYPLASIMDLHGGKPWDQKWIKLGGKTYSLNDVEHVILRPTYKDARIHFAVNCAAKSCPKVWNRAWTEQNIESALDKLTRAFIANASVNQISKDSVSLSKIFEWYGQDFGNLISFLNKYSSIKISSNAKIAFNDYDWKLNS